jgi:ribosomal protein S18 acetylase RimI-like enzyme
MECSNKYKRGKSNIKLQRGEYKSCERCGKVVYVYRYRIGTFRFCSSECARGDKYSINNAVRRMPMYNEWRLSVFSRDAFTCQICGEKGRLEADHIIPLSALLAEYDINTLDDARHCEELWEIDNGRTLCRVCHKNNSTYGYNAALLRDKLVEAGIVGLDYISDINELIRQLFDNKFDRNLVRMDFYRILSQPNLIPFFHIDNGHIVGMATLYVVQLSSRKIACIEEVVTLEEYRGKGIGSSLVQRALAKAKELGCDCVELNVREDKPRVQKFYEDLGFYDRKNKAMRAWIKK